MPAMLPQQALDLMLAHCQCLNGEEVLPIAQCSGRVLAQDLKALLAHPPRRISAMDGFAVRATQAHKGAKLRVIGKSSAGADEVPQLNEKNKDEAVQIFTGAAVPELADAIAIDEICKLENGSSEAGDSENCITLLGTPVAGRYIRPMGADFQQGAKLLEKNKLLSLRDVALAATMNYAWLPIRRKPVVAIVASGDELALPGEARGEKQIAAANSLMLALLVEKLGGLPRVVPFAKDNLESLANAFTDALQGADLLVASGGASKSNADWVANVIEKLGIKQMFSELAMRPGKPTRFALAQTTPILVLPGNPASVFVGAIVFMQPMLRKMLNLREKIPNPRYRLKNNIEKGGARSHYMRARLNPEQCERQIEGQIEGQGGNGQVEKQSGGEQSVGQVEVFTDQESAHTMTLARANCLALQPANAPAKQKGELIEILEIPDGM